MYVFGVYLKTVKQYSKKKDPSHKFFSLFCDRDTAKSILEVKQKILRVTITINFTDYSLLTLMNLNPLIRSSGHQVCRN